MDEAAVERKGTSVLKPELDHIAAMKSKSDMADQIAHLQNFGVGSLLRFTTRQDFKNAESMIAQFDQGGATVGADLSGQLLGEELVVGGLAEVG